MMYMPFPLKNQFNHRPVFTHPSFGILLPVFLFFSSLCCSFFQHSRNYGNKKWKKKRTKSQMMCLLFVSLPLVFQFYLPPHAEILVCLGPYVFPPLPLHYAAAVLLVPGWHGRGTLALYLLLHAQVLCFQVNNLCFPFYCMSACSLWLLLACRMQQRRSTLCAPPNMQLLWDVLHGCHNFASMCLILSGQGYCSLLISYWHNFTCR